MSRRVKAKMLTLGIETSCDETALALLNADGRGEFCVLSSLIHSQADLHSEYGGVYPTLAKREHGKNIVALFHKLMIESSEFLKFLEVEEAHYSDTIESFRAEIGPQNPELFESFIRAGFLKRIPNVDRIAVTEGPGLEPALWVGINFGRMLSALWQIPLVPVNHMEGHIVGSLLSGDALNGAWHKLHELEYPALALLISGGHTELVAVHGDGDYRILGETVDDAVGECFDKAARIIGLPYPGGPHLSRLAHEARAQNEINEVAGSNPLFTIRLPRPMIGSGDLNFSFSGLKTAVLYAARTAPRDPAGNIEHEWRSALAKEFEDAVADTLDSKLRKAIEAIGARSLVIGGGVIANKFLRQAFEKTAREYAIPIYLPSDHVSGDNALMIALAAARIKTKAPRPEGIRAHGTKRLGDI